MHLHCVSGHTCWYASLTRGRKAYGTGTEGLLQRFHDLSGPLGSNHGVTDATREGEFGGRGLGVARRDPSPSSVVPATGVTSSGRSRDVATGRSLLKSKALIKTIELGTKKRAVIRKCKIK